MFADACLRVLAQRVGSWVFPVGEKRTFPQPLNTGVQNEWGKCDSLYLTRLQSGSSPRNPNIKAFRTECRGEARQGLCIGIRVLVCTSTALFFIRRIGVPFLL